MVWPQRGEGAQYKSWELSLQFIFSCPSEGRCNSCPCDLLYWAAANRSARGWTVQRAGGGVQYAPAGQFQFIRILREFGGDLGACFYGAHFSMNGLVVSVVRTGLCRGTFRLLTAAGKRGAVWAAGTAGALQSSTECRSSNLHSVELPNCISPLHTRDASLTVVEQDQS